MKLCDNFKCPVQKKPYPPGAQGKSRGKRRRTVSEYGKQLLSKQKAKRIYGVKEKQFSNYFKNSPTGELAIQKLEMRLDNVTFRLGLANTRAMARQLVSHGHITVNGKKTSIPSYQTRVSQTIGLKKKSKVSPVFKDLSEVLKKYEPPSWLTLDVQNLEGKLVSLPSIEETGVASEVTLIGEFYSR